MPYDVHKPIAWVGSDKSDRLLISDVTRFGLHRTVVARKADLMNVETWLQAVMSEAQGNEVHHWVVDIGEFWFLWIVWKEHNKK